MRYFLFFSQVVVIGVVTSAVTPHSRRTSLARMTFILCGLVTINMGSANKINTIMYNEKKIMSNFIANSIIFYFNDSSPLTSTLT